MYLLDNVVQSYGWGSKTAIAKLLGRPHPTKNPEAELWMGAHPSAPSQVQCSSGTRSLCDAVRADPRGWLGEATVARFGPGLPFLLKVLAAETPLSLQAHPNLEQARRGFAAEEAAGIPPNAPTRNYKDAGAKPEVLCALGPFEALLGFRRTADSLQFLRALDVGALEPAIAALSASPGPGGLQHVFEWLMQMPDQGRVELVRAVAVACEHVQRQSGTWKSACAWAMRLAQSYPSDPGVVVALLMNLIELSAGDAIYVPAGKLHAYLGGVGVELMASSDNVLRGGLTTKHIDASELLRVVDFDDAPVARVATRLQGSERIFITSAAEFRLSTVTLDADTRWRASRRWGPEILLCVEGELHVEGADGARVAVSRGGSLFVTASSGAYELSGTAMVFRATTGDPHG